jgi:hypothetical protein
LKSIYHKDSRIYMPFFIIFQKMKI